MNELWKYGIFLVWTHYVLFSLSSNSPMLFRRGTLYGHRTFYDVWIHKNCCVSSTFVRLSVETQNERGRLYVPSTCRVVATWWLFIRSANRNGMRIHVYVYGVYKYKRHTAIPTVWYWKCGWQSVCNCGIYAYVVVFTWMDWHDSGWIFSNWNLRVMELLQFLE